MSHAALYRLELTGSSRQRGVQHGAALRQPIERAIAFYRSFFARYLGIDAVEIRRRAERFLAPTAAIEPLLFAEFEGIAEGSRQVLEDIVALSARYEITYEHLRLGECSNVFVGPRRARDGGALLGVNWEWRPEVMDFRAVLLARCDDMPDHLVVTECGQPGKYGVNADGVAAIETGLHCSSNTSPGDMLFVATIRGMLARRTLAEAVELVRRHPPEATISFFLADADGRGHNLEVTPSGVVDRALEPDEIAWHTNHCLLTEEPCAFQDSLVRGVRWGEVLHGVGTAGWEDVGRWLADRVNGPNAICKSADPALAGVATWLQTLCSIVIDPRRRRLWVSDGLSSDNPYVRFDLGENIGQAVPH